MLRGERLEMGEKKAKLRGLCFSLYPSMTASPTATSPATATCLAPKVGSPTPDTGPKVWHVGLWGCVDNFPCSQTCQTPPNSPQPSAQYPPPPRPLVIGLSPSGVNIGDVGCYIYDPVEIKSK